MHLLIKPSSLPIRKYLNIRTKTKAVVISIITISTYEWERQQEELEHVELFPNFQIVQWNYRAVQLYPWVVCDLLFHLLLLLILYLEMRRILVISLQPSDYRLVLIVVFYPVVRSDC